MRTKSCLAQIVLLTVVIVVLSLAVRQAIVRGLRPSEPDAVATATSPTPTPTMPPAAAVAAPNLAAEGAPAQSVLTLVSSRPVMLSEGYPVGLAAADGSLYLAMQREPGPGVMVARVSLADYAVVAQRDLSRAGEHRLGGIAAGAGALWTVLQDTTVPDASLLLALDAETLDTRQTIEVSAALSAVAVAPDGTLYASRCAPGELLRLTSSGTVAQRAPSLEGACYSDLEYAAGALLGVAANGNVLDVLDPATLTLLARHTLSLKSGRGNAVAGNALAFDGAQFYFAPDRVINPTIMGYESRDGMLSAVIPSVAP